MSEMATKRSILEIVKSNGKVALPRRAGREDSQPEPKRAKLARLQEARHLMLSTMMDAGAVSLRVGYLSASQFSREYSRFFGNAPTKDIARLRQESRLWA